MAHQIGSALAGTGRWLRAVRPQRPDLRADMLAALPGAISRVPDGMAAAVLAGVNPVQGLYASFAGPIAGGLSSNTRLMVITTTSAAALAAGSALQGVPRAGRLRSWRPRWDPGGHSALIALAIPMVVVLRAPYSVAPGRVSAAGGIP